MDYVFSLHGRTTSALQESKASGFFMSLGLELLAVFLESEALFGDHQTPPRIVVMLYHSTFFTYSLTTL
jgi:hypothetical protein